MQDIRQVLKERGYRVTAGRVALLTILKKSSKPLDIRGILKRAKGHLLDQVTLYRALESFVDAGLVRKGLKGRAATFEYADKPHHHHLVCTDCGFTRRCLTC
jgi:Fe2+ or Zn2+ uptake regulation protein